MPREITDHYHTLSPLINLKAISSLTFPHEQLHSKVHMDLTDEISEKIGLYSLSS